MNREVIVTCAVTGAGDSVGKHPAIPVTPEQIAESAIEAAKAGAAITHCHVREPDGTPSRRTELYAEVVDRIRLSGTDVVVNLTAGMGGDLYPSEEDPAVGGPGTDMVGPLERLVHVEAVLPEICSLDCGTLNFGTSVYVSTPAYLRVMAERIKALGVKPELECFDTGHVHFAKALIDEGLIESPPLFQICLGIPWGAPADTAAMKNMVDMLPEGALWAGFGLGGLRHLGHGDAHGGPGDPAGRPRAGRARGQPLSRARRLRQQRAAGREGDQDRRAHGCPGAQSRRDPREARPQAAQLGLAGAPGEDPPWPDSPWYQPESDSVWPSTVIAWPLIRAAASEQRNSTTSAISAASMKQRSEVWRI
jgi:uncharacterized protein (DUF849 family)